MRAEFTSEQVDRFCDDHRCGDQRSGGGFQEFEAGVMMAVGAISGSDEWAGVNDQHGSVATEPVVKKFVDLMTDAMLASPNPSKAELPTPRRCLNVGDVIGQDLCCEFCHVGDVVGKDFCGEFFDGDPARSCHCFQATSDVVGNVHGHRHTQSLCGSSA
ncbi:hypothetical protein BH10ACT2_BH10ACT2_22030 [soil metagenome]